MRRYELGEVIAEQEFEVVRLDGTKARVVVRLGRPSREGGSPEGDWMCTYQIAGIGEGRVKAAFGLDGMHSLSLALHLFPVELSALVEKEAATLRYLGQEPVFFGGPCRTLLRST